MHVATCFPPFVFVKRGTILVFVYHFHFVTPSTQQNFIFFKINFFLINLTKLSPPTGGILLKKTIRVIP